MSKSRLTKKAQSTKGMTIAKIESGLPEAAAAFIEENTPKAPRENLCVFAFRLTQEERDAIHKAAGPGKATKFVRTLAVAAARNDEAAVKAIMGAAHATT